MDFYTLNSRLATYAADPVASKGRCYFEDDMDGHALNRDLFYGRSNNDQVSRSLFQHDRDRIIHCEAFRRLEYKTQVFVNYEGDLFRTRLTHSLEVAQIARALARSLCLNEDLSEAVALAHDLGHTPFGHAGQHALNICMKDYGGFEHNLQGLRIVDELEERYIRFNGLNLTFETREGILKSCSNQNARMLGDLGLRFLNKTQPSLEAQIVNLADEIAYNSHDIEDGLRSGLLDLASLEDVEIWHEHSMQVRERFPQCGGKRFIHEVIRIIINSFISDVSNATRIKLDALKVQTIDEVRLATPIVCYSDNISKQVNELKKFLRRYLYRHFKIMRMANKAKKIVSKLFEAFMTDNRLLPFEYQTNSLDRQARLISDYIAGMTDRYAIKEYRRIFFIGEEI